MPYLSFASPLGELTAFEENNALVALEWGTPSPGAEATALLEEVKAQVTAYFTGKLRRFDVPLVLGGTDFQRKVYREMMTISYGETLSYGEIAERIESAPRAVGSACGRNPIPIIVPCHRVVGRRGAMVGYSGADGIESKRFLLSLEGALCFT